MRLIDLRGQQFGNWTVLSKAPSQKRETMWLCRCGGCGRVKSVAAKNLRRGMSKSCSCLDGKRERATTHGMSTSPEYRVWAKMLDRCRNPTNKDWPRYGGRGVRVCARWLSFDGFLADMGRRPPSTKLERNNNEADYDPANCRWATDKEQARNKRNTRLLFVDGQKRPLTEWAEIYGIKAPTIRARLKLGWKPELAVKTPARRLRLK